MSQTTTGDVQFDLVGGASPVILVPTFVNDRGPYNFLFDSGATHSTISPELASSLGIHPGSGVQVFGAGGAVQLSFTQVRSIAVGSARQEMPQVFIAGDLERIGATIKVRVDGLIGFDFMKDFRVTLDYQRNVLRLEQVPESRDGNNHSADILFLLTPADPFMLLQAFVNGQGPFPFALDTGAGRTVLATELAQRLNIRSDAGKAGLGLGGNMEVTRATLESLTVGDATVRNHAAIVGAFLDAISTAAGAKLDGIIGNNFLNQFRVTIDYPQRRLVLAAPLSH